MSATFSLFVCRRRNFACHIKILPSARPPNRENLCVSHKWNLIKLHRKVKHNEKVGRAQKSGRPRSRSQSKFKCLSLTNHVSAITQKSKMGI